MYQSGTTASGVMPDHASHRPARRARPRTRSSLGGGAGPEEINNSRTGGARDQAPVTRRRKNAGEIEKIGCLEDVR